MALDVKGKLIQLAAQMARREGMPSEYAEDYHFPKSVSKRSRILIVREAERAIEQCRLWSIAVRECADQLTTRHYIKEAGRTVRAKRPVQHTQPAIALADLLPILNKHLQGRVVRDIFNDIPQQRAVA